MTTSTLHESLSTDVLDRVVISMDSHTHPYIELKPYMEQRFHDEFDAAIGRSSAVISKAIEQFTREVLANELYFDGAADHEGAVFASGRTPSLDWRANLADESELGAGFPVEIRIKKLDEDGVAGEFITEFAGAVSLDPEFMHARFEAYCRWFAEYFSGASFRFTGSANATLLGGMHTVVDEIRFAHECGLRAIQLPGKVSMMSTSLPRYNHSYYEPMWAALADLGMAAVFHSGFGPEKPLITFPGMERGATWLAAVDRRTGMREALTEVLFGGVLERHPNMYLGYIECGTQWIPTLLRDLDAIVRHTSNDSDMLPSEQWHRQGFASGPLTAAELEGRDSIGVANLAWGSDFPHVEGSFPRTREHLTTLFSGIPTEDRRALLAGNAARIFGYDLDLLAQTPAAGVSPGPG